MRAHRRIDAAGAVQFGLANYFLVQRFAHAVEALELVITKRELLAGKMIDCRQRLRIVSGELREHRVARAEQLAGAGDIADIGMDLAGEDREIRLPFDLRALDLAVPISALDQPHHDPVARAAGEINDPVDYIGAALAIGLDHETQPLPLSQSGVEREAFEQVERELEPVRFLGVDIEPDIVLLGEQSQFAHARQQFFHHAVELRALVARVQCR